MPLPKCKEEVTRCGQGSQSCANPKVAWKPKTNIVPPHCALAWVSRPRGEGPRLVLCGARAGASGEHESMKSRETLIRLKKFQVEDRRRRVAQIEGMISEFERISGDLERDIKIEQDRSGIHDPGHFAYPTYAKAAMQMRERAEDDVDEQAELDAIGMMRNSASA